MDHAAVREEVDVRVCVLGPVEVDLDGDATPLGPSVARLLAALAIADGDVVSNDRLIDAVWGDDAPRRAQSSLRTYVTRLRRALGGGDRVVYQAPGYRLHLAPGELDSAEFDQLLDDAEGFLRVGDVARAQQHVEDALALWRGSPFGDLGHETWAQPESLRLLERRVEAREIEIDVLLATGRFEPAVAAARRLAADEPLRERPRAQLMQALYQSGRQADALREYRAFASLLADQTGLDPSDDLVRLETSIVTGTAERPAGVQVHGYSLGEPIGTGAYSVVHRGRQPSVDREVAIKVIRRELADNIDFVRRFEVEAKTIARLEHPHIVPIYDFWREPGSAFLVMRWMRGGSVEARLRARGPYSRRDVVRVVGDVAPALAAAHRVGIVHRDVRPANLLLDDDGATYLADFGIALPAGDTDTLEIAEPAYSAPEVLRGEAPTAAADVLSLGVTVFELLTGRLPFADSSDRAELIRRQLDEPLPPVRATRPDLPADVDRVLARATSRVPADRYPSVLDFAAELTVALDPSADGSAEPTRPPVLAVDNPYRGLRSFDEPDAPVFFGRERFVAELLEALEAHPMVTVVGPSGSGKSSVVRAGLLPAVRRGAVPGSDEWLIATMQPGSDPIAAFEAALLRVAVNPPASLRSQLAEHGGLLRAVQRVLPDDRSTLLVVVDQFEELFRLTDDALQGRFLEELASAVTADDSPLRIVATLRADFYDLPLRDTAMAELVSDGTIAIRPLDPTDLERCIVGPAAAVGVQVDGDLTTELVAEVARRPSALPLLQYVLTELFDRRVSGVMLLQSYRELGGLSSALAARADRLVDGGSPADAAAARRIFSRLIEIGQETEATRRRALLDEFGDDERTAWLLDGFVKARLLVLDRDPATRQPTVEVAHEALLRDWPRLSEWIAEDRGDLTELGRVRDGARSWQRAARDPGELARGGRLAAAAELAHRRPDWLSEDEHAWVAASVEAEEQAERHRLETAERDRRQNRRLRQLLVAAVVLLAIVVAASVVAWRLRAQAVDSEEAAEAAAADAVVERLIAQSDAQREAAPDRAALLALEAYRRQPGIDTASAVHRSIATDPRLVGISEPPGGPDSRLIVSADGRIGVTHDRSVTGDTVQFVTVAGGEPVSDPLVFGDGVSGAELAGDGSMAIVDTVDGNVTAIWPDDRRIELDGFPTAVDADGSRALLEYFDRDVEIEVVVVEIDPVGGSQDIVALAPPDDVVEPWPVAGAISPDGTRAAITWEGDTPDGEPASFVAAYDVPDGEPSAVAPAIFEPVGRLSIGDDGPVGIAYGSGAALWVPGDDGPMIPLNGHFDRVQTIHQGPDGLVLTSSDDRTIRLWTSDGSPVGAPITTTGPAGISPSIGFDGDVVVIARSDGSVLRIDPDRRAAATGPHLESSALTTVDRSVPYVIGVAPDRSGYQVLDYDGTVIADVDLSDELAGGITVLSGFWSNNGEWVGWWGNLEADASPYDFDAFVVSNRDGTVRHVHELESIRAALDAGRDGDIAVRPGPNGDRVFVRAAAPGGSRAGWFDTKSGDLLVGPFELDSDGGAFLLDDGRVLAGAEDGELMLLDADLDGPPVMIKGGTGLSTLDVRDQMVLLGGEQGEVVLLDLDGDGGPTLTPIGTAAGWAFRGAISPDGSKVAVGLAETGVHVFDVATRSPYGTQVLHGVRGAWSPNVAWDDEGTGVWFATQTGAVRVAFDDQSWVDAACAFAGRELTVDEWHRFVDDDPDSTPVSACGRDPDGASVGPAS